jgi:uncharacterized protein YhfF
MAKTLNFGHDGDGGLGDRLLAAVLRGEKTATSSLAIGYLSGNPLPRAGERLPLVDHSCGVHGTVETTRVTITPLHLVAMTSHRMKVRDLRTPLIAGEITSRTGLS